MTEKKCTCEIAVVPLLFAGITQRLCLLLPCSIPRSVCIVVFLVMTRDMRSLTLFTFTRRQGDDDGDRKSGKKRKKSVYEKLFLRTVPPKTKAEITRNARKWWATRKKGAKVLNIFLFALVASAVLWFDGRAAHLECCIINVQFNANQSSNENRRSHGRKKTEYTYRKRRSEQLMRRLRCNIPFCRPLKRLLCALSSAHYILRHICHIGFSAASLDRNRKKNMCMSWIAGELRSNNQRINFTEHEWKETSIFLWN